MHVGSHAKNICVAITERKEFVARPIQGLPFWLFQYSITFESKRFPHHCFKEIKNGKSLILEPYQELILKTLITR